MSKPTQMSRCRPSANRTGTPDAKTARLARILLVTVLIGFTLAPLHEAAAQQSRRSAELSAEEAAAQVQKRTGGQALGVEAAEEDGRKVYRVRILTRDGRVREITVDARRRDN